MISSESPFRRLPIDVPRRQILYLDAFRLSAEMAGIAFLRLENVLIELMKKRNDEPLGDRAVRALTDAYAVIDSAHRFREVLNATPGIVHNTEFDLFMRRTESVKELRHTVQHLNREIDAIARACESAFGTITWFGPPSVTGGFFTAWTLNAGTMYPDHASFGPTIDLQQPPVVERIGEIFLRSAGTSMNLSKLTLDMRQFIVGIEPGLEKHAENKKHFGSDQLVCLSFAPAHAPNATPPESHN